jgi:hypothetical protein
MRDRTPIEDDTADQQASAMERQPGVSVGHQDLRAWVKSTTPLPPEALFLINDLRSRVTNVLTKYT